MNKSRKIIWARHVAQMEISNEYRRLVGEPKGGKPRHRWVDNIKMDFGETDQDGMDWNNLAQDRDLWWALVIKAVSPAVPHNVEKFMNILLNKWWLLKKDSVP